MEKPCINKVILSYLILMNFPTFSLLFVFMAPKSEGGGGLKPPPPTPRAVPDAERFFKLQPHLNCKVCNLTASLLTRPFCLGLTMNIGTSPYLVFARFLKLSYITTTFTNDS